MKKTALATVLLILAGIGIAVAAVKVAYPSGTWRYKMTVSVDTPEGVKIGSAVREVHAHREPKIAEYGGGSASAIGEAVVIDLGKRGKLFALMTGGNNGGQDQSYRVVFDSFPIPGEHLGSGGTTPDGIAYYSSLKSSEKVVLPVNDLPMLVGFTHIDDPLSVLDLYVLGSCKEHDWNGPVCLKQDRFPELFSQGVALKNVTIEMTQEPVTERISIDLPWLKIVNGHYLNGQRIGGGPQLSNRLHSGDFKVELKK